MKAIIFAGVTEQEDIVEFDPPFPQIFELPVKLDTRKERMIELFLDYIDDRPESEPTYAEGVNDVWFADCCVTAGKYHLFARYVKE